MDHGKIRHYGISEYFRIFLELNSFKKGRIWAWGLVLEINVFRGTGREMSRSSERQSNERLDKSRRRFIYTTTMAEGGGRDN